METKIGVCEENATTTSMFLNVVHIRSLSVLELVVGSTSTMLDRKCKTLPTPAPHSARDPVYQQDLDLRLFGRLCVFGVFYLINTLVSVCVCVCHAPPVGYAGGLLSPPAPAILY